MYQVETLDARNFSHADARAIAEILVKVWPRADRTVETRQQQMLDMGKGYTGPESQAPRSVVIREGDRIVAHAALIPRTIGTQKGDITVGGLSRVCSDPIMRGKGLGELVVREIFSLVDQGLFEFSLFQTSNVVRPFYEKLGATTAENRFINSMAEDPQACPFWDEVVMRYPKDRKWPEGEIDLRGPGF